MKATADALQPLVERHMAAGRSPDAAALRADPDWQAAWEAYERDGYVVFPSVLSDAETHAIRAALAPHLTRRGRNDFEGRASHRVYALIEKAPDVFGPLAAHPLALSFAEAELGASCLLSALLAIQLLPGETVQDWHADDEQITVPRPRPAHGVSAFWAIDETTEANGATEVVPGSHRWDEAAGRPTGDDARRVSVAMAPGSLMLAKGTLFHRGGANRTDAPRLVVTPQYCPGWARPLEAMTLAVRPETVRGLPKRQRELLGYDIHAAFMGYVDGMHPDRTLGLGLGRD